MSARVYLSLGSNIEPRRHLKQAIAELSANFAPLDISPVYQSVAVGFEGEDFLNLVVGLDTALSVGRLSGVLKGIEHTHGRVRGAAKFSSRTLDIDILTYGQLSGVIDGICLPRDEIFRYAFVIRPLADIAPLDRDPLSGRCFRDICGQLGAAQVLSRIDAKWLTDDAGGDNRYKA